MRMVDMSKSEWHFIKLCFDELKEDEEEEGKEIVR
jgi:hypothetical protein